MEKYIYIILAVYIVVINIVGWVLPIVDKKRAQSNQWRVRESTLFLVSALGGSAAMYLSMKKYRHKTKHKRFMIGIPLIIAVQVAFIAVLVYTFTAK
ncbi:MAG: DUF1294 domain-containing protein [Oscillospiraceae bacterium]|nr:DUF1294 domain-containing protein [Oscillospiraceae bacterium]